MKSAVYLFDPVRLHRKNNTIFMDWKSAGEVSYRSEVVQDMLGASLNEEIIPTWTGNPKYLPIERVMSITTFAHANLDTTFLAFMNSHEIPIHVFNASGKYVGSFANEFNRLHGKIMVEQIGHYMNLGHRLILAKELTHGTVHNLKRTASYYIKRKNLTESLLDNFNVALNRIDNADSIDQLRGFEGISRSAWYDIMKQSQGIFSFDTRDFRPAINEMNSLISFTNALLYTAVYTEIAITQLHPGIGFVHETGANKHPLVYDLADVFKPIITDSLVLALINKSIVSHDDFESSLNNYYLTPQGRFKVVRMFESKLRTTVYHRRLKKHVSYRHLIRLESYKLIKHIMGVSNYEAFKFWW